MPFGYALIPAASCTSFGRLPSNSTKSVCVALDSIITAIGAPRWFAISTRGTTRFDQPLYMSGDAFVFGPETRGLPSEIIELCAPDQRLRLPMVPDNRSLNLSNAVAVVAFEAWRQLGYAGGA
jgi:tRNA (cytidine/uridine-2'-O-)-methyltransferase